MSQATDMATQFKTSIKNISGISDTFTTVFIFKDDSQLNFDVSTNLHVEGRGNSEAKKFAASIKLFQYLGSYFEFTFMDGTQIKYDIGGAVSKTTPRTTSDA